MAQKLYSEEAINDIGKAIQEATGDRETTYKVSDMAKAIRRISGVSTALDVNYYDYDGRLVHAYTLEEFMALEEEPSLPNHSDEGLINEGWNWSLEQAQAVHGPLAIGCNYAPEGDKTRLYLDVPLDGLTYYLKFSTSVASAAVINWGDGSEDVPSVASTSLTAYEHVYATAGKYIVTVDNSIDDTCTICFGHPDSGLIIVSHNNVVTADLNTSLQTSSLYRIDFGHRTQTGRYALYHTPVKHIATPRDGSPFKIGYIYNMFTGCSELRCIIMPPNLKWVGSNDAFGDCPKLDTFSLGPGTAWSTWYNQQPQTRTTMKDIVSPIRWFNTGSMGDSMWAQRLVIADNLFTCSYYLGNNDRPGVSLLEIYMLKQYVVPVFNSKFVNSMTKVYVPAHLYDEWIAADGWSDMADRIIPVDVPVWGENITPPLSEFLPDKRINWQGWNPCGTVENQNGCSASPFIEVNPGDKIYYYFTSGSEYICAYDENQVALRNGLSNTINTANDIMSQPWIVPEGVKYFRFAFNTEALTNNHLIGFYREP